MDLDALRLIYKNAVDDRVSTIRAGESLASPDHSMIAMEEWDASHFEEETLRRTPRKRAKPTRTHFAAELWHLEPRP
jgi:hypothetical protein